MPSHQVWLGGGLVRLAPLAWEVLVTLARSVGRAVTVEQIIADVWGTSWRGAPKTLQMHVSTLRRCLGDSALEPVYIATVRDVSGVSYRLETAVLDPASVLEVGPNLGVTERIEALTARVSLQDERLAALTSVVAELRRTALTEAEVRRVAASGGGYA